VAERKIAIMKIRSLATIALVSLAAATASLPVAAQMTNTDTQMNAPDGVPAYRTWQQSWNNGQFDRRHVILGTVSDFKPYRLTVARSNGMVQTIDLKNGTSIFPTGMTPTTNQPVAVVGYYSNGTFIANRVILHQ
jgi:hypothetical protein